MSVLCFIAAFLFFLLGLISEQIAQLRFVSLEYRFGYVLLNPWQVLKRQFLEDSNSR
jgi:hypothetical protein